MDKYDAYERFEEYSNFEDSRSARRQRRGKNRTQQAERYREEKSEHMAEMSDRLEDFVPTYVANLDPRHHERQWVVQSLSGFYANDQITDVLRLVKGGKEANVYVCRASEKTGLSLLAAKLYRPRMLRHLKNNALYKEGRMKRDADGKLLLGSREARAMHKKTRFGKDLDFIDWIGHEYRAQRLLYDVGADVPEPVAYANNVVLMAYLGEQTLPAPALHEVTLPAEEVEPLYHRVLENVRLMLTHHLIHGDLSAYNILYWEGKAWIIDFPQIVDARNNPNAYQILERDVQRVCDYFAAYGIADDAVTIAADLWHQYMNAEL